MSFLSDVKQNARSRGVYLDTTQVKDLVAVAQIVQKKHPELLTNRQRVLLGKLTERAAIMK